MDRQIDILVMEGYVQMDRHIDEIGDGEMCIDGQTDRHIGDGGVCIDE